MKREVSTGPVLRREKMPKSPLCRLICLVVFLATLSGSPSAQLLPITVDKVEPPNWRTGPSSNVMLCLSGLHLDGVVRVTVKHRGIRVVRIQSPDTNHLFVLLHISSGAEPRAMMLQLSTRFMTTFAAVPMFEENAALSSRDAPTADK
jgi:hypothetical protein